MIRKFVIGLGMVGLLAGAPVARAQTHTLRPYVATLNCIGFPGANTYGSLRGYIKFEHRLVDMTNTCSSAAPGARLPWPDIYEEDGKVLYQDMTVRSQVVTKPGRPPFAASDVNTFTSSTGFIDGTSIANPSEDTPPGRVYFNISIGPPAH
jgi:hypothetical protein